MARLQWAVSDIVNADKDESNNFVKMSSLPRVAQRQSEPFGAAVCRAAGSAGSERQSGQRENVVSGRRRHDRVDGMPCRESGSRRLRGKDWVGSR